MSEPGQLPDEAVEAMRRPEGTLTFRYSCENLFDATKELALLRVVAGSHVFLLSRDSDLTLHFVHASPGTGTRIASLPIGDFRETQRLVVCLVWSTDEIRLHVGDEEQKLGLRGAQGSPSERQLHALPDGTVLEVGGPGIAVAGLRIRRGTETVHEPTAREAWDDTLLAMEMLLTGESDQGYIFESVQTNSAVVMLVTGFEAYCHTRFVEIEREGVAADFDALAAHFKPLVKRAGGRATMEADATSTNTTPSALLASALNFQTYDNCKNAYRAGYGIRFADLPDVGSEDIRTLKQTISFRHRIIHVSPLIGLLNQPYVPPQEPVFANRALADASIELFKRFVAALHQATLDLRTD
jgi:hypothetical protein